MSLVADSAVLQPYAPSAWSCNCKDLASSLAGNCDGQQMQCLANAMSGKCNVCQVQCLAGATSGNRNMVTAFVLAEHVCGRMDSRAGVARADVALWTLES